MQSTPPRGLSSPLLATLCRWQNVRLQPTLSEDISNTLRQDRQGWRALRPVHTYLCACCRGWSCSTWDCCCGCPSGAHWRSACHPAPCLGASLRACLSRPDTWLAHATCAAPAASLHQPHAFYLQLPQFKKGCYNIPHLHIQAALHYASEPCDAEHLQGGAHHSTLRQET